MKRFIKWHKEFGYDFVFRKLGMDWYSLAWFSWFKGLITGIILMIIFS